MDKHFVIVMILVVLGFFVNADAEGSAGGCAPEVRVRKNSVVNVSSKRFLTISCPVRYCQEIPAVKWAKLTRTTNLSYNVSASETDQITVTQEPSTAHPKVIISNLTFKSISTSDGGIYRCIALGSDFISESHNIVVSVSDTHLQSDKGLPLTVTPPPTKSYSGGEWIPYFIVVCGIIFCLVAIVMFIIVLRACVFKRAGTSIKHPAEYTTVLFTPETPRYHIVEQGKAVGNTSSSNL